MMIGRPRLHLLGLFANNEVAVASPLVAHLVITRPAPLPNWLWMAFITTLVMAGLAGILAIILAVPAGVTVGSLLKKM